MNKWIWIGMMVWGVLLTLFGASPLAAQMPAHDLAFLGTGGMLSFLLGGVGLTGLLDGLAGLRADKKIVP